jgi:16S rRNA (cytosine1402-N4)-methyltransferase
MCKEALEYLVPVSEGPLMVDATCGEGGHSEIFLSRYPEMRIAAVDADSVILEVARARLEPFVPVSCSSPLVQTSFFRDYPPAREAHLILFDLAFRSSLRTSERGSRSSGTKR